MSSLRACVHLSEVFQGNEDTGTGGLSFLRLRTWGRLYLRGRPRAACTRTPWRVAASSQQPYAFAFEDASTRRWANAASHSSDCLFSEFLARGSLGWTGLDEDMRAAANCADGLPAAARWKPREWLACIVCAMADWGETRIPVKIGGTSCRGDCPPE